MPKQIELAGVHASRRGNGVQKFVNSLTADGGEQLLTGESVVYNIPEGYQFMLSQAFAGIETASDHCTFKIVGCTEEDGGGDCVESTAHVRISTGTVVVGTNTFVYAFLPPIRVAYSSGIKSVTVKIDASDSSCVVSCGYNGWFEEEL
jgi:hypothetical protein